MTILPRICVITVFVLAAVLGVHSLNSINQDIGRHIKTGEIIWQTLRVPHTNLFSFTEPNTPFINHHWLSEVIFYGLNNLAGLQGLIVFKSLILIGALLLLYRSINNRVGTVSFVPALLAGIIVISDRTDVRPEIFSFLALAYFLFSIFRAKYHDQYNWLYWTPLAQLFWSNMHIYFAFGPALIGLFAIDRWLNGEKRYRMIFGLTGLCILSTLINPNGISGALTPLTIFNNYGYSVAENQSIFFLKDYEILIAPINIFILVTMLFIASYIPALKRYGFRSYVFELGAGAAFIVLAIMMIRNFGPYAIVMIPILAMNIDAYLRDFNRIKTLGYAVLLGLVLLFAISVFNNSFYRFIGSANQTGLAIPLGAQGGVDFIRANNIAGPVFNNFDVGSYLIWKLYPEQKVFVDGRPEAYTEKFFSDIYKPMQQDPAIWKHYADDIYHINYIFFSYHDMTPWAKTFLSFISHDKNWPMVYLDDSTIIFLRRTPQNLPLIQKFAP